ncbi:uncharacterized protein LOC132543104 [Ylistrum balloti]|uniref:uncharacterized protein LOC132543104 n=1 Tax=Ylistrum balloti TaxID=509963 RepID=UPI002905DC46|nr:uncharacterized protein LOC132543104 [Ylistrum balloti]
MSEKRGNSFLTAIVIGAGIRGSIYAQYAHLYPNKLKIVGVADPREFYRGKLQQRFDIKDDNCFSDWSEASERDKMSDCVIITTPDRLHKDPVVAFANKGYFILLEKPMAVNEDDCREIVKTCQENNVIVAVCHVLRYTPWANKLKELIDSGLIGEVVNINHIENAGFWFFAHCFVRGNWHIEAESSSSLLAKCCHDVDLINFWMAGRRCTSISSFGHLSHFNKESKPPGAASRCMECPADVESKCPYSAKKIYLDQIKQGDKEFPVCVLAEDPTIESVTTALKTGPYGVCVYDNDNDVMSNQVVNMQFEGGATATLTMAGFTKSVGEREVKVYGTKGQLSCTANSDPVIKHYDFLTGKSHEYQAKPKMVEGMKGYGGADFYCMDSFVSSVTENNETTISTGPEESLGSHLLVFAAEKARKEKRVVMLQPDGTYN